MTIKTRPVCVSHRVASASAGAAARVPLEIRRRHLILSVVNCFNFFRDIRKAPMSEELTSGYFTREKNLRGFARENLS